MDLGLAGRTALVTGGSSGFGRAVALRLAAEGASIALVARREEPLRAAAADIARAAVRHGEGAGAPVLPLVADVTDDAAITGAVARVEA